MPHVPDKAVVDVWIALLKARDIAFGSVEASFKANGMPPFAWYDVLWELEKEGIEGLRPFKLEQRLLLTQYGLSRLLVRLEEAGYIRRESCDEDRRGHRVIITAAGQGVRCRMWDIYSVAIQTAIGDRFTKAQCKQLHRLLEPLLTR